jgi:hypothetical protein
MGIDPGESGGIVVMNFLGEIHSIHKIPESISDTYELLSRFKHRILPTMNTLCTVENVHGRPGDGGSRAFNFGYSLCKLHAGLELNEIDYVKVVPRVWQKSYGIVRGEDDHTKFKSRLKAKAQELFPGITCTLWNCDALLIAEYTRRYLYNK